MDFSTEDHYVTLLLNRLGRRRSDDALRTSVVEELALTQRQLELGRFLPWFLVKKQNPVVNILGSEDSIPVPTDFIREEEETQPYIVNTAGDKFQLKKGLHDILQTKYLNTARGTPKYYSILGSSFYLWPTPSETFAWHMWYYAKQAVVVDTATAVTNPWLLNAADWLLYTAGISLASFHIQKADMASRFAAAARVAMDNVVTLHEARIHTNMNYSDDSEYQTGS